MPMPVTLSTSTPSRTIRSRPESMCASQDTQSPTLYPVRSTVRISEPPDGGVRRHTIDRFVLVPVSPSVCTRNRSDVFGDELEPCAWKKHIHGRLSVTWIIRLRPLIE